VELRRFGDTGLTVSRIGLGMAALGRPGYINLGHSDDLAHDYDVDEMERRAHDVLDAAWNAGIRYFDAARSYGLGERFLGAWLTSRAVPPESVTVGSKWGYTYTADWKIEAKAHEVKEHSLATLERQWPESHALLDGYLNIYQIHSATFESGVLDNPPVLEKLAQLKADGIRIGLTLSGPSQGEILRRAMGIEIDGTRLFDSVQATWNLLEPSAGSALAEASAAGIGVIIKEALANGRLTDRNQEPDFASKLRVLQTESGNLATSTDALVLAACLSQSFPDIILSGAANTGQILSNVQACRLQLDQGILARLLSLAEPPAVYWTARSKLAWN
jgi:aryl-alcohol dehydrogenase-like predicted oxidoreductase